MASPEAAPNSLQPLGGALPPLSRGFVKFALILLVLRDERLLKDGTDIIKLGSKVDNHALKSSVVSALLLVQKTKFNTASGHVLSMQRFQLSVM